MEKDFTKLTLEEQKALMILHRMVGGCSGAQMGIASWDGFTDRALMKKCADRTAQEMKLYALEVIKLLFFPEFSLENENG